MKIIPLKRNNKVYSCNSYLILGDWNHIGDLNTIIDPGTDDFVIDEIERLSTGFGKVPVAQVILTHNHFDHAGAVTSFKKRYNARVLAFHDGHGVDARLSDGDVIKAGDGFLEVLHTPGHSSDSICLYSPQNKTLFSGDTQLHVRSCGDVYSSDYVTALSKIACREILKIYSGHDEPIMGDCREMIRQTMRNVSRIDISVN